MGRRFNWHVSYPKILIAISSMWSLVLLNPCDDQAKSKTAEPETCSTKEYMVLSAQAGDVNSEETQGAVIEGRSYEELSSREA